MSYGNKTNQETPEATLLYDLVKALGPLCTGSRDLTPVELPHLLMSCARVPGLAPGLVVSILLTLAHRGRLAIAPSRDLGRITRLCVVDWKLLEMNEGAQLSEYLASTEYTTEYSLAREGQSYLVYTPNAVLVAMESEGGSQVGVIVASTADDYYLALLPPGDPLLPKALGPYCNREMPVTRFLEEAIKEGKTEYYTQVTQPPAETSGLETEETEEEEENLFDTVEKIDL